MNDDEMRVRIYEWGKQVGTPEGLALARRFLDIRAAAALSVNLIEEVWSHGDPDEQASVVTKLEVTLVHELANQIAKARSLFEVVSGQLHSRGDAVAD